MARYRHLNRAPITEALIDIRVKLPPEKQDPRIIQPLHDRIRQHYPDQKQIQEIKYEFKVGPPNTQTTTANHLGYRYTSADGLRVIQATINGFTFSRLKPYENWENLRGEAYPLWELYQETVRSEVFTRVATRFINVLEIPGPTIDLDDYLTAAPIIPKTLPQVYAGFFSRIVVPDEKTQTTAIVTQAFEPGSNPQITPIILDVDVFKVKQFANEADVWATIDSLREVKNRIFFDWITEKTAKLFE